MSGHEQHLAPDRRAPGAPGRPGAEAGGVAGGDARDRELADLRRELALLRDEVARLRERVHHVDGELGFAMMTTGRLRGRLDREVEARQALEERLARPDVVVLPDKPAPARTGLDPPVSP